MKNAVIIHDDCGLPYLIRLTIFELFGFALKLHTIIRSDRERELHDHPWTFITLMLSGGYWEETPIEKEGYKLGEPTVKIWHKPGSIRFCKAPYPHRLELEPGSSAYHETERIKSQFIPAVTLVLMFPRFREWGFYSNMGWLHWKKYVNSRICEDE